MITEVDYEEYRLMLKDCSMSSLLRMNDFIAEELLSRHHNQNRLPMPIPRMEISQMKLFMETVYEALENKDEEIKLDDLTSILSRRGFSTNEVNRMLKSMMSNGYIYEKRANCYASTKSLMKND